MYASHVKVGQTVQVTSDCGVFGCTGEVVKAGGSLVRVKFSPTQLPVYYGGNNPVTLSPNSLKLINQVPRSALETVEKSNIPKQIGVFFEGTSEAQEFQSQQKMYVDNNCLVVMGHTKEHCLRLLDDEIGKGDCDDETFEYLLFDGIVYSIKPQFRMVIDDEH